MVKSVGLRTARSSSCRLHALAPRSLSGEFCFVGSFLGLTASDSSGCSGSSSLLLSVACGWSFRSWLSSLSLLLWCPLMVFGGAHVRVGFVSLAVAPVAARGVVDPSVCGLGLLWRV
ncbi:hypothetical protein Bca52824_088554 [Brassica carinata]|uniref:Uncharacterized protein n=1 Tax=Brassica carinata TaxID=52824 RepID=A0A8X7TPP4_BRACI|nr:hypothetical protein Bca52824_088554 [Brassica carinata]